MVGSSPAAATVGRSRAVGAAAALQVFLGAAHHWDGAECVPVLVNSVDVSATPEAAFDYASDLQTARMESGG